MAKSRDNCARVRLWLLVFPGLVLLGVLLFLYARDALSTAGYVAVQKDLFFSLNRYLGEHPGLMANLTQCGDCIVLLPFVSLLFVYAPRVWEALLPGLLVSVALSASLKKLFAVPRPARVLEDDSFIIVGKKLAAMNSTPSGHSISIFVVLTVLLFAFMPQKTASKVIWAFVVIALGLLLASTRVGVGAHWPLDVVTGCAVGCISGILGIFVSQRWKTWAWAWVGYEKCRPLIVAVLLAACGMLVQRISGQNLPIYYLAFASLGLSLYKIVDLYVKSLKKTEIPEK